MKKFSLKIMAAVLAASVSVSSVGAMKPSSPIKELDKVESSAMEVEDFDSEIKALDEIFKLTFEALENRNKAYILLAVFSLGYMNETNEEDIIINVIKAGDLDEEYFLRAKNLFDEHRKTFIETVSRFRADLLKLIEHHFVYSDIIIE